MLSSIMGKMVLALIKVVMPVGSLLPSISSFLT